MRLFIAFVLVGFLVLSGCTQVAEQAAGELNTCLKICQDVCSAVKSSNVSLDGYNQIGLEKKEGSLTITCGCLCQ